MTSEPCRFSAELTFLSLPKKNPPTSPFLSSSRAMRAVIDQLFQQEMRGHLSEACLNSELYAYPVVPRQLFTWLADLHCLRTQRESFLPSRSWSLRCSSVSMFNETSCGVFGVVLLISICSQSNVTQRCEVWFHQWNQYKDCLQTSENVRSEWNYVLKQYVYFCNNKRMNSSGSPPLQQTHTYNIIHGFILTIHLTLNPCILTLPRVVFVPQ